jgi:hypothetical protein
MSELPPPYDPSPYASAGMRVPGPRPKSVTVIAVIAIIFGALGVLGTLCSFPQYLGFQFSPNPVIDAIRKDSLLLSVTLGTFTVSFVAAAFLLYGGIGALSLKPSARKALIVYSIIIIFNAVVGLALNLTVTGPRSEAAFRAAMQQMPQAQAAALLQVYQYTYYGGMCFSVVFLVWPAIILFYMNQPHVKAAFGVGAVPPP